jgi:hypothetical protein
MLSRYRHFACVLAVLAIAAAIRPVRAGEPFPFGSELMLDTTPAPGSKRLPMIEIEDDGSAAIDLWCGSLRAQATVSDDGAIAITPGPRDNAQCTPDRVAGDDDLLDRIVHMTKWQWKGDVIELSGDVTMRFHQMTN